MWTEVALGAPFAAVVALYLLSAILPGFMGTYSEFLARCIASWLALLLCASYGVVASIALRCIGRGGLSQWTVARAFKYVMWAVTGVTFDVVRGEEYLSEEYDLEDAEDKKAGRKARVIVGNHQT